MIPIRFILLFCFLSGYSFLVISCDRSTIPASLSSHEDILDFLEIVLMEDADPALRYTALEPIISKARTLGEFDWLISILGSVLERNPDDPYGAYYLMSMAEGAGSTDSDELALDYLRRLLNNYPDLIVNNRSIHHLALREITLNTHSPREAIAAREEIQTRFSDRINVSTNHFYLASEYKKIGEWESMYDHYKAFLADSDAVIPGVPDARSIAGDALRFHSGDKSWTMVSLDSLVQTIKYAIQSQNIQLLHRYQSENFFFMNWSQETSDSFTHIPMTLGSFLTNRVRYKKELDEYSNDREAFLWTAGWTWKIPTWYLYFRKIDYPVDPEINGRWEWGGIYFGERI